MLAPGEEIEHSLAPDRHAWVQVVSGKIKLNGLDLKAGDGAAVSEEGLLTLAGQEEAEVLLFDNCSICAHAGLCTDNLASVFRMKQEPWIDPNAAAVEAIVELIRKCPSGALSYTIEDVEYTDSDYNPAVTIAPNGPYVLTGDIDLQDMPRGEGAVQGQCTLCRCGGSKNKPFCDGSHWYNDFKDEEN